MKLKKVIDTRALLLLTSLAVLGLVPQSASAQSATCQSDTLANYIGTACLLGGSSVFEMIFPTTRPDNTDNFQNSVGSILASQIEVTPTIDGLGGGFIFCLAGNGACSYGSGANDPGFSGGQGGLDFSLFYREVMVTDPFIAAAEIGGDPPTGNVVITEDFCADPHPAGGIEIAEITVCTNGPYFTGQEFRAQLQTGDFPNAPNPYVFPITPPAVFQGLVTLDFNIGSGSSLGALLATHEVVTDLTPEPVTSCLGLGGLAVFVLLRRRRSVG